MPTPAETERKLIERLETVAAIERELAENREPRATGEVANLRAFLTDLLAATRNMEASHSAGKTAEPQADRRRVGVVEVADRATLKALQVAQRVVARRTGVEGMADDHEITACCMEALDGDEGDHRESGVGHRDFHRERRRRFLRYLAGIEGVRHA